MELQELMELIESIRILNALNDPSGQFPDVKDILEAWRLRTPNAWDSVASWATLSVWRNHMYNLVIGRFATMPDTGGLQQVGYRDKAWTVNQLARIARKQGHPTTAVHLVNSQYGYNAMEVQEAFVKITEQAKSYMVQANGLMAALNFLNTTTMEYFQPQHQAEILRLKGNVLEVRCGGVVGVVGGWWVRMQPTGHLTRGNVLRLRCSKYCRLLLFLVHLHCYQHHMVLLCTHHVCCARPPACHHPRQA